MKLLFGLAILFIVVSGCIQYKNDFLGIEQSLCETATPPSYEFDRYNVASTTSGDLTCWYNTIGDTCFKQFTKLKSGEFTAVYDTC